MVRAASGGSKEGTKALLAVYLCFVALPRHHAPASLFYLFFAELRGQRDTVGRIGRESGLWAGASPARAMAAATRHGILCRRVPTAAYSSS